MIAASAFLLLLQAAQAPGDSASFGALWLDWESLGQQSMAAEMAPAPSPKRDADEAAALGRTVGEVVAAGDCAIGERLARQAGDIPLAQAVRAHCYGARPSR